MPSLTALLLILQPAVLLAQEAPAVEEARTKSGQERLALAIRLYRAGDHDAARDTLINLLNDPKVEDLGLMLEARVYLGEVFLTEGKRTEAFQTFRAILEEDHEHKLDPYEHPPDVVEFFGMVKAATRDLGPDDPPPLLPAPMPPPPVLQPMHWTGYAPFGVHQLRQERYGWFSVLAVGQLGTLAGTFATGIPLYIDHAAEEPDYSKLVAMRSWNWALSGAFAAMWITGTVEASVRWRSDHRAAMADWEAQRASSELMLGPGTVGWRVGF
jgi:hypothetical protein